MGHEQAPAVAARRPLGISRASRHGWSLGALAALAALATLGLGEATATAAEADAEASGEPAVLPEASRGERWSPRDDGDGFGARKARKRPKREVSDDDESWLTSTGTNRFVDRFYELGVVTGIGGPMTAPGADGSVGLTGIRVMENHGYLSKILVVTMMAMGMRDKAHVSTSYSTDAYGNTWRTDYYRSLTPQERQAQQQALSAAVNAEYVMELNVYTRGLWGFSPGSTQAGGFEYYLGGETVLAEGRMPTILQIAGAFSYLGVSNANFKGGQGPHAQLTGTGADGQPFDNRNGAHVESYKYWNVGVMLRAMIPINEWLEASIQWDLNILSFWDMTGSKFKGGKTDNLMTSPLRAGLLLNLTDRAYLKANGSVNVLGGFGLGYGAELGVRF